MTDKELLELAARSPQIQTPLECEVRMITFMRKTRPTFVKAVASSSTLGSAANGVLAGQQPPAVQSFAPQQKLEGQENE